MLSLTVSNTAIEAVLNQHSGVEDCAVVPFFDQSLASDVPKALGMHGTPVAIALTNLSASSSGSVIYRPRKPEHRGRYCGMGR